MIFNTQKKQLLKTLIITILFILSSSNVYAATQDYFVTPEIPIQPVDYGQKFFEKEFTIDYQQGMIVLSSSADGTRPSLVDDQIRVRVLRTNQTYHNFGHTYQASCKNLTPKEPVDISHLFMPGENQVRVQLYDVCGFNASSSEIHLTNLDAPDPPDEQPDTPEPFLKLPWNYEKHGLTFNEAALTMSSYFDHTYPLLSRGHIQEPSENQDKITKYDGVESSRESYSSHDGYDYAKKSKAILNEQVLAAASGCASYHYHGATGHAIHIDHGNQYQTRYYHLMKDDLITNTPNGQCINVEQGQPIGLIGYSGNVIPKGSGGAHIHFMVVKDKDNDGFFEDNIPGGVVDPYGWQGDQVDPWSTYEFEQSSGDMRTGSSSHYLWLDSIATQSQSISPAQPIVSELEKFQIHFPQHFLPDLSEYNLNMTMKPAIDIIQQQQVWRSLGSIVDIEITDSANSNISHFDKPITLSIEFKPDEITQFDPQSLTIFSNSDDQDWLQEATTINWENYTATAQIDHLSQFALMAKAIDTTPPQTTIVISTDDSTIISQGKDFIPANQPIQISFDSTDNHLGVESTWYQIDDQSWELYKQPININEPGDYTIRYYSVDLDDNSEILQTKNLHLDFSPPEIQISYNLNTFEPDIRCIDNNTCEINTTNPRKNLSITTATDNANNTKQITYLELSKNWHKNKYKFTYIRPIKIQTNNDQPTQIEDTSISIKNYLRNPNSIKQKIKIGSYQLKHLFNASQDQTTIIEKLPNQEPEVSTQSGQTQLILTTDQNEIKSSYH